MTNSNAIDITTLTTVNGELVTKINDVLHRLHPTTAADYVTFTTKDGAQTSMAEVLAEVISELEKTATAENMEQAISSAVTAAVTELVGGAPEALDTFKEVCDEFEKHSDVLDTIKEAQLNKVSKEEGKSLVSDELIAILSNITTNKIAQWNAAQANVLEKVSVNGEALVVDSEKGVDISVPVFSVASAVPDTMKNGDICFVTK